MKRTITVTGLLLWIGTFFLFTCGVDPISTPKATGAPHAFVRDSVVNNLSPLDTNIFSKCDTARTGDTLSFFGVVIPNDTRVKHVRWDFADGKQDAQSFARHAYGKGGRYEALFSIYDDIGHSISDTVIIYVNTPPDSVGILSPGMSAINQPLIPKLEWKGIDHDEFDTALVYMVIVIFENGTIDTVVRWNTKTTVDLNVGLEKSQKVAWYVIAKDRFGDVVISDTAHFSTMESDDATLLRLRPSFSGLVPVFSPSDTIYFDTVEYAASEMTITAVAQQKHATVSINQTALSAMDSSASVTLSAGTTRVAVAIIAPDGIAKKTYSIYITRLSDPNSLLRSLSISSGKLVPNTAPLADSLWDTVSYSTKTITLTPFASDTLSAIAIGSQAVKSGDSSAPISLGVGKTNIGIKVTSADLKTKKTIIVCVIRMPNSSIPVFTSQPHDTAVVLGGNPAFFVTHAGLSVSVQWRKNNADLPQATSDTMKLSSVQIADAGIYTIKIWNQFDSTISTPFRLKVLPKVPSGFSALARSASSIGLSWNQAEGASWYRILRASAIVGFASICSTSQLSFVDTPLTQNDSYFYKIRGGNGDGESDTSAVISIFTITFDGQGANTPANPTSKKVISPATTIGSLPTPPSKTGLIFGGWFTQPNGAGTAFTASSAVTGSVTIYAKWSVNAYTVTFDDQGASTPPNPSSKTVEIPATTVDALPSQPIKAGYTFGGWFTEPNGAGTEFTVSSSVTATVTVFAKWNTIAYAVTYYGNDNTGGSVPVDNARYVLGQSVTTLDNTGLLVKNNYTFVGWNTQANGSGTIYATGVTFTMGSANVVLYAQWTALPTYTVTYDGNGTSTGSVPVDNNKYLTGASVRVLGNTGTLTKNGYTFIGWNTQTNGSGTSYAAGVTFSMASASVILYAQWTTNPTYSVIYKGNGSSGGSVPTDVNNYATGATVTALNPGSLIKTDNTFTGWNTAANGSGTAYAVGTTLTMGSANITLYAQWSIIPAYTVTYNGNGNDAGIAPVDNAHYVLGQSVTTLDNSGLLNKNNYTFVGWNTQANGSGTIYATGVTFTMGSANVVLYAQWTALPTYTVTYDGNGGTGAQTDLNQYLAGATAIVQGQGTVQKSGFTFAGWTISPAGAGKVYSQNDTLILGAANITLIAKWTTLSTPTLVSPSDGLTGQSTSPMLSWNTVAGAATYQVQISTFVAFSTIVVQDSTLTTTSKTISSGLTNNTVYFWRVRAKNSAGFGAWSEIRSFTTIIGQPTLTSPVNGATGVSISPTLTWNPIAGVATYHVQVSTFSGFSSILTQDSTLTVTSKTISSGLTNNTLYYWRVRANNSGGAGAWSETRSFTTIIAAPAAPTLTSPTSGATGVSISPTLTWNAANGATTYYVQVSTSSGFSSIIAQDSTFAVTSKTISGLTNNTLYYWRVRAKNAGGVSAWSTWSFTTIDITPPTVISTNPASGAIGVSPAGSITATFSKAMTPVSITTSFTLKQGSTSIPGSANYPSGTNTAIFTPISALSSNTQYTATISTAVTDIAGNHLVTAYSWSFTTADVTQPTVGPTSPLAGATDVLITTSITATFSKVMNANSITGTSFMLKQGAMAITGVISYIPGTKTATFAPTGPLAPGANYTATITTDVTDAVGNAMGSPYIWSFSTMAPPTSLSYSENPANYWQSVAITQNTPTVTGSVASYSVSPALPAGLTLNTTTGIITGTPTATTVQATYTITATNPSGSTQASLLLAVNGAPTSLSYSENPANYWQGVAITQNTPTVTGSVASYSVSPALPAGLTLNTTTGIITGTPTATAVQATYTITATNPSGSTQASLLLAVNGAPTSLSYSENPANYWQSVAITQNTPTVTGSVASYSVSPALPAGLTLNTTTGVISGTPTAIAVQATYTITATNPSGSTQASLLLAVNGAPNSLSYSENPANYWQDVAITQNTPTMTGSVASYSVSPALPAGLTLNTTTGVITGTPTATAVQATYTITATNPSGSTQASLLLAVNGAPTSLSYSENPANYWQGVAITQNTPTVTGSVASYSVSPALPAGLTLNTTTGVITGTPTATAVQATYTITATNPSGSTQASLLLAVNGAPTSLSYSENPASYSQGVAITNNVPSVTGVVTNYSVDTPLPDGLSLDPSTGVISGTPNSASLIKTYTVTAFNPSGTTTVAIPIEVN